MAQGNPNNIEQGRHLTADDRQALLAMQERITNLLSIPAVVGGPANNTGRHNASAAVVALAAVVETGFQEKAVSLVQTRKAGAGDGAEAEGPATPEHLPSKLPISDDDDTDEATIATPGAPQDPSGLIAVATAEIPPDEMELEGVAKTSPTTGAPSATPDGLVRIPRPLTLSLTTQHHETPVDRSLPFQ
jgi:hypothetical protein